MYRRIRDCGIDAFSEVRRNDRDAWRKAAFT
jgi:hypothetical protein